MAQSLQSRYAPQSICFGCGPANAEGLRVQSVPAEGGEPGEVVASWRPQPHHAAFEGVLSGGVCGTLLDCHSNWTAAYSIMRARGAEVPPTTVTASFEVALRRPTPMDRELALSARPVEVTERRAVIEATLSADGEVTATFRGTFAAVKEGHPAFGRW